TPMHLRRNAGLGMARIVDLVDRIARDYGPDAVGTVGHVEVFPIHAMSYPAVPSSPWISGRRRWTPSGPWRSGCTRRPEPYATNWISASSCRMSAALIRLPLIRTAFARFAGQPRHSATRTGTLSPAPATTRAGLPGLHRCR